MKKTHSRLLTIKCLSEDSYFEKQNHNIVIFNTKQVLWILDYI